MIRRLIAWKLRLMIRLLDDSVPAEKLQAYLKAHAPEIGDVPTPNEFSKEAVLNWIESIRKDNKKIWQEMDANQREMILFIDHYGSRVQKENILRVMELLLRHVEVKRKKSFIENEKNHRNSDQVWEKRFETSLLFCEFTKRHDDLRYINASIKINDWAFHHFRFKGKSQVRDKFLLALQIQEKLAKRLEL
jgi:hypothetical protein